MHALTNSMRTLPSLTSSIIGFSLPLRTNSTPIRERTQVLFKERIFLPDEFSMISKNGHMVAYATIAWHHPPSSPFSQLNIPAISKLFVLNGYLSGSEITQYVYNLERRMMKFGHLSFGSILSTDQKDYIKAELLFDIGYDHEILTSDPKNIYLLKRLKLLR